MYYGQKKCLKPPTCAAQGRHQSSSKPTEIQRSPSPKTETPYSWHQKQLANGCASPHEKIPEMFQCSRSELREARKTTVSAWMPHGKGGSICFNGSRWFNRIQHCCQIPWNLPQWWVSLEKGFHRLSQTKELRSKIAQDLVDKVLVGGLTMKTEPKSFFRGSSLEKPNAWSKSKES